MLAVTCATRLCTCLRNHFDTRQLRQRRCIESAWPLCGEGLCCVNVAIRPLRAMTGNFEAIKEPDGCVTFTVRRYNSHVVGFSGIRSHILEKLRDTSLLLPADIKCKLHTVPSLCARCKRSLTLTPAVSYLPCGHSCLCADCDGAFSVNKCFSCNTIVKFKLIFRK